MSKPHSLRLLFTSLFFILISAGSLSAQYIEHHIPFEHSRTAPDHTHIMHAETGAAYLCSVDSILRDSQSVTALRNYQQLRRAQPKGALAESLLEDYEVGDERNFRVRNLTNNSWDTISFTLRAQSDAVRIWVEDGEFAPDQVNDQVLQGLLTALDVQTPPLSWNPDAGILEIHNQVFGDAPDIDGSGILNILITDIQDGWDPDSDGGTVAGFFDPVDLDPSNNNSNATDIIYLNSTPLIYFDGTVNLNRVRSVASHEYQHLIHANYGLLHIFQNEGQSEWAELLTGYSGRVPNYLSNPLQIDQNLYTWRRDDPEVLFDYQRATTLHAYINERLGAEATGSITRSSGGRFSAYESIFQSNGLNFSEVLLDFHIANFVNDTSIQDGRFGYEDIRRRANTVTFPTFRYFSGQTTAEASRSVNYGAAEYIEWIGVENFELFLDGTQGIGFALVKYPVDPNSSMQVEHVNSGTITLSDQYERVVLVIAGTEPVVETVPAQLLSGGPKTLSYSYSSTWETLPIISQVLSYAGQPSAFAELPGTPGSDNREGIRRLAKRFSPEFDSRISEVGFVINGRDSSLIGSDDLRISFHQSTGTATNMRPGSELGVMSLPVNQLSRGTNNINVSNQDWQMAGNGEYFIVFEVMSPSSRIEFLLDAGSANQNNPNYYPARTRIFVEPPSSNQAGWYTYSNHNNIIASIRISGEYSGPLEAPVITSQPQNTSAGLGQAVSLSVGATAVPEPVYQWYRNGIPMYGQEEAVLEIEKMSLEDEGEYTVRLSNPAGSVLSDAAQLFANFDEYQLVQNFPNPVRTETSFRFTLPQESQVSLDLFDINGRRVASVLRSTVYGAGQHEVAYQADALASGVYYFQIRAQAVSSDQRFTKSMKMLRLR